MPLVIALLLLLFGGPCTVYAKVQDCEQQLAAPIGIPEADFAQFLDHIRTSPEYKNILCLVFFGSRTHHERGYPPELNSDLDVMFFKVHPRIPGPILESALFAHLGHLEWARLAGDPFHVGTAARGDMEEAVFPPESRVAEYRQSPPTQLRNYLFGPMPFHQELSTDEYMARVRAVEREARDGKLNREAWRRRHIERIWPAGLVNREALFVFLRDDPRIPRITNELVRLGYTNIKTVAQNVHGNE